MANYIEPNVNILTQAAMTQRSVAAPLDRSSVFSSYEDAVEYALGNYKKEGEKRPSAHDSRKLAGTSYVGQTITVYENDVITLYTIQPDRSLAPLVSGQEQVQVDWNEADSASTAFIQNKPDLSGFATTGDVADAISELEIALAGKSDTAHTHDDRYSLTGHTHDEYAASSHTHDDRYYTEEEVDNAISVKMDTTAVTSAITEAIAAETARTESTYLKSIPENYATTGDVANAVSGKAEASAITELEAALAGKSDTGHTHDDRYSLTGHTHDMSGYSVTGHNHDDVYYTKQEVDDAISGKTNTADLAAVATSGSYNDLEDKPTIPTVPTNVSEFNNDAGYITSYTVTKQDVTNALEYEPLSAVPENYATTGYVSNAISEKADSSAVTASINAAIEAETARTEETYLKAQDISGKADTTAVTNDIASAIATETARTESTYLKSVPENYATTGYVSDAISGKADASDLATVATSGSYNDLEDKPTIPTVPTSNTAFTNDAGYLVASDISGKADAQQVAQDIASAVTDMATQTWANGRFLTAETQYEIERLATPESGASASYVLKADGVQAGATINIPVQEVLEDASIKTVVAADKEPGGIFENNPEFIIGDKYIDFQFSATNHQYLNARTLISDYSAGDGITIDGTNAISVKVASAATASVASGSSKNFAKVDANGLKVDGMDTDVTVTTQDIQVVGGPISANNIFENNVIPAGTSVQEILTKLLCKENNPTATLPKVSVVLNGLSSDATYEVGTQVTPSYVATLSAGSYTYGPATNISAESWTVSDTNGNSATTASGSFAQFTVGDNTAYRISASATYGQGAMPKTNLGNDYPAARIAAGTATTQYSKYIRGHRKYFYGGVQTAITLDSAGVRSLTGASASNSFNVSFANDTTQVIVAFPTSANKNLVRVLDNNASDADITGNFEKSVVAVEGANGYTAVNYDVWVFTPSVKLKANTYKITLG